MVAVDSPICSNMVAKPVKAITIAINPKSCGVSRRANTTTEPIRRQKLTPLAPIVNAPPRTERPFRSFVRCPVSKNLSCRDVADALSSFSTSCCSFWIFRLNYLLSIRKRRNIGTGDCFLGRELSASKKGKNRLNNPSKSFPHVFDASPGSSGTLAEI